MSVVRFPRASKPTPLEGLGILENFARTRALSCRFKNNPVAAVKWSMQAKQIDVELALAADIALEIIAVKRLSIEADERGDRERAMQLRSVAARLNIEIQATGKRHRVRGWRQ